MTNEEIFRVAMKQSAIDANCSPDDFMKIENIVVVSKPHEDARRYLNLPFFCDLVSYGNNVVASVDERVADFVKQYIGSDSPAHLFETPQIHRLTREFERYGFIPCFMAEYWLPDMNALRKLPCEYDIRVLERDGFAGLYLPEWSNALCEKRRRLDMLAIGAFEGERLIGLAGCSADCDSMWQIGVDVLPEYRRHGIAAALTSRLAMEVMSRGKVPFYCCAWSNIASARNAIKSGFRPAWVEHTAIEIGKASEFCGGLPLGNPAMPAFWTTIDKLIAESEIAIDQPKGTKHPHFDSLYPLDYGYLKNTASMDGSGIDVWRGSLTDVGCDAIICTVDLLKRDSEIKLVIGCTEAEKEIAMRFHNDSDYMKGVIIRRGTQ
jgi:GNAT superfamily N-acetyltransferase